MVKMVIERIFQLTDSREFIMAQKGIIVRKSLSDCCPIELYLKAIQYSGELVLWYNIHQERKNKTKFSKEAYRQSYNGVKNARDKLKIINSLFTLQAKHDIAEVTKLLQDTENWKEKI